MNQEHIIPRLRRLAELEGTQSLLKKNSTPSAALATEIDSLRALLPTSILRHHDSRKARGMASLVPVSGGICGACHLAIPRGRLLDLQRNIDALNLCDHCGVFIFLTEEPASKPAKSFKNIAGAPEQTTRLKRATRSPKTHAAAPAR